MGSEDQLVFNWMLLSSLFLQIIRKTFEKSFWKKFSEMGLINCSRKLFNKRYTGMSFSPIFPSCTFSFFSDQHLVSLFFQILPEGQLCSSRLPSFQSLVHLLTEKLWRTLCLLHIVRAVSLNLCPYPLCYLYSGEYRPRRCCGLCHQPCAPIQWHEGTQGQLVSLLSSELRSPNKYAVPHLKHIGHGLDTDWATLPALAIVWGLEQW